MDNHYSKRFGGAGIRAKIRWFSAFVFTMTLLLSCVSLEGSTAKIEGVIKIKGAEPFTIVTIETTDNKTYELRGSLKEELIDMQGQFIELRGFFDEGESYILPQFKVLSWRLIP